MSPGRREKKGGGGGRGEGGREPDLQVAISSITPVIADEADTFECGDIEVGQNDAHDAFGQAPPAGPWINWPLSLPELRLLQRLQLQACHVGQPRSLWCFDVAMRN